MAYNRWLSSNELMHSGRLGMKWGVQNGPPYPLSRQKRFGAKGGKISKETYLRVSGGGSKKANKRITNKGEKPSLSGVGSSNGKKRLVYVGQDAVKYRLETKATKAIRNIKTGFGMTDEEEARAKKEIADCVWAGASETEVKHILRGWSSEISGREEGSEIKDEAFEEAMKTVHRMPASWDDFDSHGGDYSKIEEAIMDYKDGLISSKEAGKIALDEVNKAKSSYISERMSEAETDGWYDPEFNEISKDKTWFSDTKKKLGEYKKYLEKGTKAYLVDRLKGDDGQKQLDLASDLSAVNDPKKRTIQGKAAGEFAYSYSDTSDNYKKLEKNYKELRKKQSEAEARSINYGSKEDYDLYEEYRQQADWAEELMAKDLLKTKGIPVTDENVRKAKKFLPFSELSKASDKPSLPGVGSKPTAKERGKGVIERLKDTFFGEKDLTTSTSTRVEDKMAEDQERNLSPERPKAASDDADGFEKKLYGEYPLYTKKQVSKTKNGWNYEEATGEHPSAVKDTMKLFHKNANKAINKVFKAAKEEYTKLSGEEISDADFRKMVGEPSVYYLDKSTGGVEIGFYALGGELSAYYYPADDFMEEIMFND